MTFAHTVGTAANRILFVLISSRTSGSPTTIAYGGNAMTQVEMYVSMPYNCVFYLVNPPSGSNNVVMTCPAGSYYDILAISYSGVNTSSPIGNKVGAASSAVTIASQSDRLLIDFLACNVDSGHPSAPVAIETQRGSLENWWSGADTGIGVSETPGTASKTMTWTVTGFTSAYSYALELIPYVEPRGRAIDYYVDVNDPDFQLRDPMGRIVPPWAIRSDTWGMLLGISMPTGNVTANFAQDQTGSYFYIEQVTYNDESGQATIVCTRGDLDKVALARAAGQGTA